jgi:hypothetical protein
LLPCVADWRLRTLEDKAINRTERSTRTKTISSTVFSIRSHFLPDDLRRKIEAHVKYHESTSGFWKQFIFGLLLPAGLLLGGTFDLDRDLVPLRNSVADALSSTFSPGEYRLEEYITDGKFTEGWTLLRLFL